MIVAIPVDETREALCVSFARAPFVLFYNTDSHTSEIKENPAAQAEGGAGVKASQFMLDGGAEAIITIRCGENAAQVLKAADVSVYKSQGSTVQENIDAFQEGKLSLMTSFHAGFHGIR